MPGTPPTSPIHAAPRYVNTDTADFAGQVNAVTDRFDITAMRLDTGLAGARPAAGIAGRWYYATDTRQLSRDTGAAWDANAPNAHAGSHQDGGTDPLVVREAMAANGPTGFAKGTLSAYRSLAVSLASGTVVLFDAEEVDISSWYDPATGRFTPQVTGYYRLSWAVRSNATITADTWWTADVRKNGTVHKAGMIGYQRGTERVASHGTAVVGANGTTDFFDVQLSHGLGATAVAVLPGAAFTYFQGELIGRS